MVLWTQSYNLTIYFDVSRFAITLNTPAIVPNDIRQFSCIQNDCYLRKFLFSQKGFYWGQSLVVTSHLKYSFNRLKALPDNGRLGFG